MRAHKQAGTRCGEGRDWTDLGAGKEALRKTYVGDISERGFVKSGFETTALVDEILRPDH